MLCRQWKNVLYTPLLLEHSHRSEAVRPLNVTFALPDLLEDAAEWPGAPDESCLLLRGQPPAADVAGSSASLADDAPRGAHEDLYQWMAKQEPVAAVGAPRARAAPRPPDG